MVHLILLTGPTAIGTSLLAVFGVAYVGYKLKETYFKPAIENQKTNETKVSTVSKDSLELQKALNTLLEQFKQHQLPDAGTQEHQALEQSLQEYLELNQQVANMEPKHAHYLKEQQASAAIVENATKLKQALMQHNPEKTEIWANTLRPYIKNYEELFYHYLGVHYGIFATFPKLTAKLHQPISKQNAEQISNQN